MAFDMSGWLDDDSWRITGVASEKHPDGGSYAIPCPSIRDTALLRRIEKRYNQIRALQDQIFAAVESKQAALADKHRKAYTELIDENTADIKTYLGADDLREVGDVQEAMEAKLLGPVRQELIDDGVSATRLERVYQATVVRFTQNEAVVRMIVELEGKATALDNRATRRAAKKAPAKAAARNSSPKATSRSSRASSATKARSAGQASTRSSKTSAAKATKQTA